VLLAENDIVSVPSRQISEVELVAFRRLLLSQE